MKSKIAKKPSAKKMPRRDDLQAAEQLMETYTPERIAEFLLNNAVSERDYARAVEEVRKLGLDPKDIPHSKPCED